MPPSINAPMDGAGNLTAPFLPVEPEPGTPIESDILEQDVPVPSEELRAEIVRIQTEEQTRIDFEKQAELARLRELARFD